MQDKSKVKANYSERLVEWMMNALFELAEYVIAKCSLPVQEQKITPPTPHADNRRDDADDATDGGDRVNVTVAYRGYSC
jgi:hypothetical protein